MVEERRKLEKEEESEKQSELRENMSPI